MFAGVDKLGGGVVGSVITEKEASVVTMGESASTASAEETLVGRETAADGTSKEVLLQSRVDPTCGGLCWVPVQAQTAAAGSLVPTGEGLQANDNTALHSAGRTTLSYHPWRLSSVHVSLEDDSTQPLCDDRSPSVCPSDPDANAVRAFKEEHGRAPVVLDIGCGTGLLSMIAARAGAERVYGCELYEPLARIARDVTELNCEGKIKIISKRSTDVQVGPGKDMSLRADMCINEIYDSILLGEACLPALRHALEHLLTDTPVVVPSGATVHGVLLCSPSLRARHDLSTAEFSEGVPVARNSTAASCAGGRKALPLQGAEVRDATRLSKAFHSLDFDFAKPFPEEGCRSRIVAVRAESTGTMDAIMMTWDLALNAEITYSTRPGSENWQDHWSPCYFPVPGRVEVQAGDTVRLQVIHSELNIAFEVLEVCKAASDKAMGEAEDPVVRESEAASGGSTTAETCPKRARFPPGDVPRRPASSSERRLTKLKRLASGRDSLGYRMEREWDPEPCACGWHVLCNPERIGTLRDKQRQEAYRAAIGRLLQRRPGGAADGCAVCLDVGDGATCAFLAAEQGAAITVSYQPAEWSHLLVGQVVRNNGLTEKVYLLESADEWPFVKEMIAGDVDAEETAAETDAAEIKQEHLLCDALIGEPFYYQMQSLVLYEAINFWYLRKVFHPALKPNARVLPTRAIVCVATVELPDLSLSHGPVGSVLGFNHGPYDERVRDRWHKLLYPYPLRAYEHRLVSEPKDLLSLDYTTLPANVEATVDLEAVVTGTIHAVAIWVDYQLDESLRWSTFGGRTKDASGASSEHGLAGGGLHDKQMLRFLEHPIDIDPHREWPRSSRSAVLTVRGRFDEEGGCMTFDVTVGEGSNSSDPE